MAVEQLDRKSESELGKSQRDVPNKGQGENTRAKQALTLTWLHVPNITSNHNVAALR